jgi:hypothetical protein
MRFIRTFDEMIAVLVLMVKNLATYQTEVGATAAISSRRAEKLCFSVSGPRRIGAAVPPGWRHSRLRNIKETFRKSTAFPLGE